MSWKVLVTARAYDIVGEPARNVFESNGCQVVIPDRFGPMPEETLNGMIGGIDAVLCSPAVSYTHLTLPTIYSV